MQIIKDVKNKQLPINIDHNIDKTVIKKNKSNNNSSFPLVFKQHHPHLDYDLHWVFNKPFLWNKKNS